MNQPATPLARIFIDSADTLRRFDKRLEECPPSPHIVPLFASLKKIAHEAIQGTQPDLENLQAQFGTANNADSLLTFMALDVISMRFPDPAIDEFKLKSLEKIAARGPLLFSNKGEIDALFITCFEDARRNPAFVPAIQKMHEVGIDPSPNVHQFALGIIQNDAALDNNQQQLHNVIAGMQATPAC